MIPNASKESESAYSGLSIQTKHFIPTVQALESRLNNLSPMVKPSSEERASTRQPCALKRCFARLWKRKLNLASLLAKSFKEKFRGITNSVEKLELLQEEMKLIKTYMESHQKIYAEEQEHTDILNIYWYSKTEVGITEKIRSYLKHAQEEISKLEH